MFTSILAIGVYRYRRAFDVLSKTRRRLGLLREMAAGIAHEIRNPLKLYQERIHPARERVEGHHKTGGMGLGLAISSNIVKAHNGRKEAKNRSAGGTEITIFLPVK